MILERTGNILNDFMLNNQDVISISIKQDRYKADENFHIKLTSQKISHSQQNVPSSSFLASSSYFWGDLIKSYLPYKLCLSGDDI